MSEVGRILEEAQGDPDGSFPCGLSDSYSPKGCKAVLPTEALLGYHRDVVHGRNVCGIDGCEQRRMTQQELAVHQRRVHHRPGRVPLTEQERTAQKGNLAHGAPFGGIKDVRKEEPMQCPVEGCTREARHRGTHNGPNSQIRKRAGGGRRGHA